MDIKQEHKNAINPKTGKLKPKYKDLPRFPKVQTEGYEKDFKENYEKTIKNSVKELSKLFI